MEIPDIRNIAKAITSEVEKAAVICEGCGFQHPDKGCVYPGITIIEEHDNFL